ncbi:MAG TPA: RNA polymerase sigma factor [Pirellulaceae bacterium]|nr:RNA polymerase sigma factor [Pirellulaceae bacterium]
MAAGEDRQSDMQPSVSEGGLRSVSEGGLRVARWVAAHGRAVRGYLLGMVRRPDVADDLLQEVFRRAWQFRDRYRDEGRERAYLLRIADRLVADRGRRLHREITIDEETWQSIEPALTGTADEALAEMETSIEVATALDKLTPVQRRVLLLRYFGELTFEEIAAALDCPLGTALSHCRRGLLNLRRLMPVR